MKSGVNLLLRALDALYSSVLVVDGGDGGAGPGLSAGVGDFGEDREASSTATVLVRETAETLAVVRVVDCIVERRGMVRVESTGCGS